MKKKTLKQHEFDNPYGKYIAQITGDTDLIIGFKNGKKKVINFFEDIPIKKLDHRYATDKWSIKEVLQHMIDTERIFIYRSFRIARRDHTNLAGFDQNIYTEPSKASKKSMSALLKEFKTCRKHSISILRSLSTKDLSAMGLTNGVKISSRAMAFSIIGHDKWHMDIIKKEYL